MSVWIDTKYYNPLYFCDEIKNFAAYIMEPNMKRSTRSQLHSGHFITIIQAIFSIKFTQNYSFIGAILSELIQLGVNKYT